MPLKTEEHLLPCSLFKKCISPVEKVLRDSKMSKQDINEIILVGGSTRIPNTINASGVLQWKRIMSIY